MLPPTDEKELVTGYLMNKILQKPLPPNNFKALNIYMYGPQKLSGQSATSFIIQFLFFFYASITVKLLIYSLINSYLRYIFF